MSKVSVKTIHCEKCGKEIEVNVYSSVNVSLDHELKEKLVNGELTDISCDHCGYVNKLRYPILYHKMGFKSIMIQYTQENTDEIKKQYEEVRTLFSGNMPINPFPLKSEEIFEVYNQWDDFIQRVKEIG